MPPGCSGLPSEGADPQEVARFTELRQKLFFNTTRYNDLFERLGYARYPGDALWVDSQVLTVYAYPEEIDYQHVKSLVKGGNWFNLEVFNKGTPKRRKVTPLEAVLPAFFLNEHLDGKFSGKYVYVSLGSMGSIDLELMRRLLSALRDSPHKYIVSKGPLHDQYQVAGRNQWGDRFLPQLDILPQVDLVITHGGNNSVTEIFAQGKPCIVVPLFADQ